MATISVMPMAFPSAVDTTDTLSCELKQHAFIIQDFQVP